MCPCEKGTSKEHREPIGKAVRVPSSEVVSELQTGQARKERDCSRERR